MAFTGVPTLPAVDPTNANHATRKSNVDALGVRIDLLDIELDTKASRVVLYDELVGGTDTLLVASGPYNTWNSTPLTGSVNEVNGHRYLYQVHFPGLHTNQNGVTFSFWIPPTRVKARLRRDAVSIAQGYTAHMIANKSDGSCTIVGPIWRRRQPPRPGTWKCFTCTTRTTVGLTHRSATTGPLLCLRT